MYSTTFLLRLVKVIATLSLGIMLLIIVFGNLTDYNTNFQFVKHVLNMDTIFPDSHIQYRSINNTVIVKIAYAIIIGLEALMAFCCLKGALLLAKHIKDDAITFHSKKNWAIAGFIIGILIWFLGFQIVGGEWFAMWQSTTWNGLDSANRITTFIVLVLILFSLKEEEL